MPIYKMDGKKDGKQQYRVRVNYKDISGKNRQIDRVAYGLNEANMLERKIKSEVLNDPVPASMSIDALYEIYMKDKKINVRETSYDKTRRVLEKYVIPCFRNTAISKITVPIVQSWKSDISTFGLSVVTMNNIFGEFRAMMNYAVKMEFIAKNPLSVAGGFKDAYFQMTQEKIHYYTADEFKKYIEQAHKYAQEANTIHAWGFYVFFMIAFFTGMRKGEINALKWSDIDGDIIHVRRSIAQKINGKPIVETPPKNRSSYRDLQAPKTLVCVLAEHLERQKKSDLFTPEFRVCGGVSCLSDSNISLKNTKFAEKAGIHRIRIHDFRHSHVSLLANEGINIQEIARRLGHSKIEMTWNTYSHLYPREEERAVSVLDKIEL